MGNMCCEDKKTSTEKIAQFKSSININQSKVNENMSSKDLQEGSKAETKQPTQLSRQRSKQQLVPVVKQEALICQSTELPLLPLKQKNTLDDFAMHGLIGKGAFGKVFKVKKRDNEKFYAMKQIEKKRIVEHNLEESTVLERNVLKQSKHPFIVELKYSFQSASHIYFVMELVSGGEFYKMLQQAEGHLPENVAKFVSVEIILALEYLNTNLKVIYRDLKPENVLITTTGHIKLTDFGLATLKRNEGKTYTLAGTPEYLAPEIITRSGHSFEVDLWTLGIIIYEMLNGEPPFTDANRNVNKIQQLILKNQVFYPPSMSEAAIDLISSLLKTNPAERLGYRGYQELKEHPFFKGIRWDDFLKMKMQSPLKNYAQTNTVRSNSKIIKEKPVPESPTNGKAIDIAGITYNQDFLDGEPTNQGYY